MTKLILIVYLLGSRDNFVPMYAVKYETEKACIEAANKIKDPRSGMRSYPVKFADCVMEIKL